MTALIPQMSEILLTHGVDELVGNCRIMQTRGVAERMPIENTGEQTPEDLSRSRLRQLTHGEDVGRFGDRPDLNGDVLTKRCDELGVRPGEHCVSDDNECRNGAACDSILNPA